MTDAERRRNARIHLAALAATAVIFVVDLQLPLIYGVGILYVLVILLGLWTSWEPFPVVAALGATLLRAVDFAVGWAGAGQPAVLLNQPLLVLVFVATAMLVRHFKRLERLLVSNVRQLSDITRALDHAAIVATTDVGGRITYVNDKFCEISKFSRDELIGQDHRIINSTFHSKGFIRDLWRTIAQGRVWHGELRNRARDGTFYWVDTTIVPFLTAEGKPYQYIAIRSDITARKAAEQRLAEQAALARLGQMAAVVAHEVRNPLAGIKGAMQVLMARRSEEDAEAPVMRDVIARIDSLGDLINDVMMFARPRPPHPTTFDLQPLLLDALATLRRDPLGQSLEVSLDGPPLVLTADADLLRAAVLNLLLNSAQALRGRGRVALTVSQRDRQCILEIRDDGPGIRPELRERVFEPFFTTKARGGGLGLAIARRTAELHGGTLSLECPDDGGTVFTLTVPVRSLAAVSAPAAAADGA